MGLPGDVNGHWWVTSLGHVFQFAQLMLGCVEGSAQHLDGSAKCQIVHFCHIKYKLISTSASSILYFPSKSATILVFPLVCWRILFSEEYKDGQFIETMEVDYLLAFIRCIGQTN